MKYVLITFVIIIFRFSGDTQNFRNEKIPARYILFHVKRERVSIGRLLKEQLRVSKIPLNLVHQRDWKSRDSRTTLQIGARHSRVL